MATDRLIGLTLIVVAVLIVVVSGLWTGHTGVAFWSAGLIVVTGVSAGLVGERLTRRR